MSSSLVVQQGTNFKIRISHPMYNTLNASLYPFERVIINQLIICKIYPLKLHHLILQLMIRNPQIFT